MENGPPRETLPGYMSSQPTYLRVVAPRQSFSEKNARVTVALGVIQLLVGVLSIIFQSAATSIQSKSYATIGTAESAGAGIWCGSMFLLAGILGVSAGKKNSKALIISFMIFSILASVLVWVQIGFEISQLASLSSTYDVKSSYSASSSSIGFYNRAYRQAIYWDDYGYGYNYLFYYSLMEYSAVSVTSYYMAYVASPLDLSTPPYLAWRAMNSMLFILAVLEFAVATAASTYCCKALGCCSTQPARFQVVRQNIPPSQAEASLQEQPTLPTSANQGLAMHPPALLNGGALRTENFDLPPDYGAHATSTPYGLLANVPAGPSNHGPGLASAGVGPSVPSPYYMQVQAGGSSEFTNLSFAPPSYEDVLNDDMGKVQQAQGTSS